DGQQTPWWEVDLGAEVPVDSVVIWNRTDGNFGNRLNNYTLKVLDARKNVVFQQPKQPAPDPRAVFEVGGESAERVIRRAAMNALTSVRGKEADAFQSLAKFLG